MPVPPDEFIEDLWRIARQVPMLEHPWFRGIIEHIVRTAVAPESCLPR